MSRCYECCQSNGTHSDGCYTGRRRREHVDYVSLRDIARLDARQAKAIEAQSAKTEGLGPKDESAVRNSEFAPKGEV